MASDFGRPSASMEGRGSYNRHSLIPSGGGALALPHLERAIAEVPLEPIDQPVVIADYGSSQGLNSLGPMRLTVESVRGRGDEERPILVYHIDQPSNDFNSLFELLDASPDRYSLNDPYVFPCAVGRSFYENVLPANSVHVGWSSYAAMWVTGATTGTQRLSPPWAPLTVAQPPGRARSKAHGRAPALGRRRPVA